MRAAALLSLLCLTACLCGCGGLRSKALTPPANNFDLMRVTGQDFMHATSPEARHARVETLKPLIWLALRTAAEHGRELAPMLFGNGTNSFQATLKRGKAEVPHCTEEDGFNAQHFMTKAENWYMEMMETLQPYMMNLSDPYLSVGMGMQVAKKMEKSMQKVSKKIKHEMPRSCNMEAVNGKGWSQFVTCAHQAANISKPCIRCGSNFFTGWTSSCQDNCFNGMLEMADDMAAKLMPIADEMLPYAQSGVMDPEAEQKIMKKLAKIETSIMKSMKKLLPCVKCSHHKVASLFTCLNLDHAFTEDLEEAMKSIEDQLKSGNITVTVDNMGSGGAFQPQPVVPLQ